MKPKEMIGGPTRSMIDFGAQWPEAPQHKVVSERAASNLPHALHNGLLRGEAGLTTVALAGMAALTMQLDPELMYNHQYAPGTAEALDAVAERAAEAFGCSFLPKK